MTTINQSSYGSDYHSLERMLQCFFHTNTNSTLAQKSETRCHEGFCPSALPGASSIYNSALLAETSSTSTDFQRNTHSSPPKFKYGSFWSTETHLIILNVHVSLRHQIALKKYLLYVLELHQELQF